MWLKKFLIRFLVIINMFISYKSFTSSDVLYTLKKLVAIKLKILNKNAVYFSCRVNYKLWRGIFALASLQGIN